MRAILTRKLPIVVVAGFAIVALLAANAFHAPVDTDSGTGAGLPSVENMIEGLAERLSAQPGDFDGWLLLGKSYLHVGDGQRAKSAFAHAVSLAGKDPEKQHAVANALGRYPGWDDLNASLLVRQAQVLPGPDVNSVKPGEIESELTKLTGNNRHAVLTVGVSVSDRLLSDVSPDSTVFIVARADTETPIPLAVLRKKVSDLPLMARLDDEAAMIPEHRLSTYTGDLLVVARISNSGSTEARSGDYEGFAPVIRNTDAAYADIVIDRRIP